MTIVLSIGTNATHFDTLSEEEWLLVAEYPGYEVSSLGRVRSSRRGFIKVLKPNKTSKGYMHCTTCVNNERKTHKIHRLVAKAFIPNPNNKPSINHIDSNTLNNCITNLEWCTTSENQLHSFAHGNGCLKGSRQTTAKLHEDDIPEIRDLIDRKISLEVIGEMYGVHKATINDIKANRTWTHV